LFEDGNGKRQRILQQAFCVLRWGGIMTRNGKTETNSRRTTATDYCPVEMEGKQLKERTIRREKNRLTSGMERIRKELEKRQENELED